MRLVGIDVSAVQGALVEIDQDASLVAVAGIGKTAKTTQWAKGMTRRQVAQMPRSSFAQIPEAKSKSGESSVGQTLWWADRWRSFADIFGGPDAIVAFEDYAYGMAQGAHQIGERSGLVREAFARTGCALRYSDIGSIKLWATGSGDAKKPDMQAALEERFPQQAELLGRYRVERDVQEGLVDAFWTADFLRAEWMLRHGLLMLRDLPEPRIRAFNRVTKGNPVNVLGRDWIR